MLADSGNVLIIAAIEVPYWHAEHGIRDKILLIQKLRASCQDNRRSLDGWPGYDGTPLIESTIRQREIGAAGSRGLRDEGKCGRPVGTGSEA
jgi:hypothetical protein